VSPRDPRFIELKNRADEWDRSVYWVEDPDEIDLEIIPPTSPSGPFDRVGGPLSDSDPSAQCRALAYLAGQLLSALRFG
jgi:hypothetical protein